MGGGEGKALYMVMVVWWRGGMVVWLVWLVLKGGEGEGGGGGRSGGGKELLGRRKNGERQGTFDG